MQTTIRPFRPLSLRATQLSVGTTVANTLLTNNPVIGGMGLRIVNIGSNTVSLSFSNGADAALTASNGLIMLPNTAETFFFADDMTHINYISAVAGNTLSISFGEGS